MGEAVGWVVPVVEAHLAPVLLWDATFATSVDGAALACPQCAWPNLHLGVVQFAAPAGDDQYTPTVGVGIDAATAVVVVDDQQARDLHAGDNRGPMLAVGYWCERGCQGRIELRQHKGCLYASLHNDAPIDFEQYLPDQSASPAVLDDLPF